MSLMQKIEKYLKVREQNRILRRMDFAWTSQPILTIVVE
jgi:hypothetical protein